MKIKKNDNVLVIAGKDKGKTGKVRFAFPGDNAIMVEGVNMIKKARRATGQVKQAGIIELEAPIPVANVMLVCGKCNKPTRVGMTVLGDGRKARVCRVCREVID
ncbi:MAG: 50S ribosomal protein L24 [Dehalococcoidales bacterium]|nr:50S ribosomal protein L24 [Dehalococcoidales bacterium]